MEALSPHRGRELTTPRLAIRPTTAADAARADEILRDWRVTSMLRMASFLPDRAAIVEWFSKHELEWEAGTAYRFAIHRDHEMIGLVDLDEIDQAEGELGYWLHPSAWRFGYALEAAAELLKFGFEELRLTRLRSGHAADNSASGRVLAKLGFHFVETVLVFSRSCDRRIEHKRYVLERPTGRL